uniref:Uncharacterized protein n=1 Tax=Pinguiococcus pyrenoidosus TaxID=172671 RepID=A0A7R9YG77_9STRA
MAGRGEYGRLGLNDEKDTRLPHVLPIPITRRAQAQDSGDEEPESAGSGHFDLPPRVEDVSLGGTHSVFLASGGHVYTCGRGDYGRLGKGDLESSSNLSLVASLSPEILRDSVVVKVAAGGQHTLALVVNPDALEKAAGDRAVVQLARDVLSNRFNEDGFTELSSTVPRSPRPTSPLPPSGRRRLTSLSSLGPGSQHRGAFGNELRLTGSTGSDNNDVLTIERIAAEEQESRISHSPGVSPRLGDSFNPADLEELLCQEERGRRPRMLQRRRL